MGSPETDHGSEAVARLSNRLLHRTHVLEHLLRVINHGGGHAPYVLVSGPPSSGKTTFVRELLQELPCPHAWVAAVSGSSLHTVFGSICRQLAATAPANAATPGPPASPDSLPHLIAFLEGVVLAHAPRPVCVVVDDADRLRGSAVLDVLARLRRHVGGMLRILLLSRAAWASGVWLQLPQPFLVSLPQYSREEVADILAQGCPPDVPVAAFESFVDGAVLQLWPVTRTLRDLQHAANTLWPRFYEPVLQGKVTCPYTRQEQVGLVSNVASDVRQLLSSFQPGCGQEVDTRLRVHSGKAAALELPVVALLLLLAAFIVSRNAPTLDRTLFDSAPTTKRRRTHGMHPDKQAAAALAAQQMGPKAFPLSRLLAVFNALWRMHAAPGSEDDATGSSGWRTVARVGVTCSADWDAVSEALCAPDSTCALQQLASLLVLGLLHQDGDDLFNGARLRCCVEDEVAYQAAQQLRVPLQRYLRYA